MNKEYDPLTGELLPEPSAGKPVIDAPGQALLGDDIAARLDSLSIERLHALCRRLLCQCGHVALMTKEETAQAMLDELAMVALKPVVVGLNMRADIQSKLAAIDKWLDRERGKATQRIEQDVKVSGQVMMVSPADCQKLISEWIGRTHDVLENVPVVKQMKSIDTRC